MIFRSTAVVLAIAALCPVAAHADESASSIFSFSGFGTLGAVHSDEKNADFTGNKLQPNGAGHTSNVDFGVDSKLGAQVNGRFTDKLSGVVQVIAQQQANNHFSPRIEWANLKYQVTPELSARVGRIVLPTLMVSDSLMVGYANHWVRPPQEVYTLSAITNSDGVDLTYRSRFGSVNNTLSAFYGASTARLAGVTAESDPSWGVNDSIELGSLTLRASYVRNKLTLKTQEIAPLLAGLAQTNAALAQKYSLDDMTVAVTSIGASYDPGQWFVMAEVGAMDGQGLMSDATSWYASGGYRLGKFTPYVTYAQVKPDVAAEGAVAGVPAQLIAGLNMTKNQFAAEQKSLSFGLRWDVAANTALKVQYDRLDIGANSNGTLTNTQAGFQPGKVNVVSLALDFVF